MEIPEHIIEGLGLDRVRRIRMAWDFALVRIGATTDEQRDQLAEFVVQESRDPGMSIGEIAVRAHARLRAQSGDTA